MSKWKTIDSAPQDGTIIIGYIPNAGVYGGVRGVMWLHHQKRHTHDGHEITIERGWVNASNDQHLLKPTHWIPCPKVPQTK